MESRGEENERGDQARKLSTGKWDSRKKRKNLKRGNDHKNLPEMKDVRESTQGSLQKEGRSPSRRTVGSLNAGDRGREGRRERDRITSHPKD